MTFSAAVSLGGYAITVNCVARGAIQVEPNRALRYHSRVGTRDLAHCTGLGKVLAASLDERRLGALLVAGLPRRTPATTTGPAVFRPELERIRRAGYAEDLQEGAPGLRCLAEPVREATGSVVAAISISGVAAEFEDDHATYLAALLEAASDLSACPGCIRPAVSVEPA